MKSLSLKEQFQIFVMTQPNDRAINHTLGFTGCAVGEFCRQVGLNVGYTVGYFDSQHPGLLESWRLRRINGSPREFSRTYGELKESMGIRAVQTLAPRVAEATRRRYIGC